ncbi:toxin-antitoxin system YwqK family antitoxin [Duganella sp. Dugasp56]|uniref:toxin-antitoxin system YwqK family antitoxin n=1 Tax=Duganella sp. Dugasp56 TaxID=3243046 RepID=UPI0039AEB7B5
MKTTTLQKYRPILVLFAATLSLQACSNKMDCNGDKVKENALSIIQSHLSNAVWYNEMNAALSGKPNLSNIKTLTSNSELNQTQCSAKYSFTYNEKSRDIDFTYNLSYLQDKKESEVKVALNDLMSGMMAIATTEPPIKNGTQRIIDPKTRNLQHQLEWKNGIQDGIERVYNPETNKLIAEIHVKNGKKDGTEKRWSQDGSVILIDLNWENGLATGREKQLDSTGQKVFVDLNWNEGKATGLQTNGNLSTGYTESNLKDGKLDGQRKTYSLGSDGKTLYVSKIENFKDGKLHGSVQDIGDNGSVLEERKYQDGIEVK